MPDLRDLLARYHAERGGSAGETASGVRELSDMFNGITPHRPGYLANPRLRRAYVHYYLPVNAEKVRRVLRELDAYAPDRPKPRVLDFGCGPGTASEIEDAGFRSVGRVGVQFPQDPTNLLGVDGEIVVHVGPSEPRIGQVARAMRGDPVEHVRKFADAGGRFTGGAAALGMVAGQEISEVRHGQSSAE